jgi:phosphatidylinositol phospholipase C delta
LGLGGEREATKRLKVRVLSGSCLPKPDGETIGEVIDPYVTVAVHDVVTHDDDSKKQVFQMISHSTAAIHNNGYCPVWNETKFHEFAVEFPEVAMVQFKLMESDVTIDDKIADASIPFSCLRRGYRSIQLYDTHGTRTGPFSMATLLVEIDYE